MTELVSLYVSKSMPKTILKQLKDEIIRSWAEYQNVSPGECQNILTEDINKDIQELTAGFFDLA